MDMDLKQHSPRDKALAPLVQAGLAALVAGSLLLFSAIAFRTGFLDDNPGGVTAAVAGPSDARPVVLPAATPEAEVASRRQERDRRVIALADIAPGTDVVLGTKVARTGSHDPDPTPADDTHDRDRGTGHDKGKGKGHHKDDDSLRELDAAKEDDDDEWDGHARDDDDDDDHSDRSGGSGSHSGGSGSHSGGSRSHSGGGSNKSHR